MYSKPTLSAGWVWAMYARFHSQAFGSAHMGSGPGVAGSSGMQVQPLVPCFKVRILPSAAMTTTVASRAMDGGAADWALAMSSWSDFAGVAEPARPGSRAAAMTAANSRVRIGTPPQVFERTPFWFQLSASVKPRAVQGVADSGSL